MITINNNCDPSVTYVFLENMIDNPHINSFHVKSPELSMEQLHAMDFEEGSVLFVDNYADVENIVNAIEKYVQFDDLSQTLNTGIHNLIPSDVAGVLNIQRVFRGYLVRRRILLRWGLAKRKKWEPKNKTLSITVIHSKFRRLARADLRDRALSSYFCPGGGSMIVAIRRVCATIIQRYWRIILWKRYFEQRLVNKFMMKQRAIYRAHGDPNHTNQDTVYNPVRKSVHMVQCTDREFSYSAPDGRGKLVEGMNSAVFLDQVQFMLQTRQDDRIDVIAYRSLGHLDDGYISSLSNGSDSPTDFGSL
jgi:hypothetical protein